jgi:hypothetical protein
MRGSEPVIYLVDVKRGADDPTDLGKNGTLLSQPFCPFLTLPQRLLCLLPLLHLSIQFLVSLPVAILRLLKATLMIKQPLLGVPEPMFQEERKDPRH